MKAKVTIIDERTTNYPTFEDIQIGEVFTEPDDEYVYIKMGPCECEKNSTKFNAVCLDGDTSWFEDDEPVAKINTIAVNIT